MNLRMPFLQLASGTMTIFFYTQESLLSRVTGFLRSFMEMEVHLSNNQVLFGIAPQQMGG